MLVEESRKRTQEEFHTQNLLLINEVNERQKTEKLLSEAKKNADAANRAKSRYLSGISHELRTPLNTITGYGQILSQSSDIPPKHQKAIRIMCRSADYLADLIEGLLDISKIEAGRLELHYENLNLKQLIDELIEYFSEKAFQNDLKFTSDITVNLPQLVYTDEKRLRQILINLLSNAVKYTSVGGVNFTVKYRNEVAEFIIKDSGIGIKESELKKIFEPFNRLDEAKKKAGGTGLGLTITNLLVTIMGGELDVNSIHGVGTTFSVKMKLSRAFADPNLSKHEKIVCGYSNSQTKPFKILEVDDNEDHRNLVVSILKPVDFIVDTADCPDSVLIKTTEELSSYSLFLVDIAMPVHNGWYLLRQLRSLGIRAPIIMVSAEASEGNVPEDIRNLHNGYIIKPFKQKRLFDAIARVLPVDYIYKEDESSCKAQKEISLKTQTSSQESITEGETKMININSGCTITVKLPPKEKEKIEQYISIGYINGIKKIIENYFANNLISQRQKELLLSLTDEMKFDELKSHLE